MKTHNQIEQNIHKPTFRRISVQDLPILSKFFAQYPSRSCDFSIGGVLMWADYYDYEMAIFNESLFIRGKDPVSGNMIYYRPVGPLMEDEYIRLIYENSPEICNTRVLLPIESTDDENPDFDTSCAMDLREYLYPIERFLHFSGKKMEKKRNHLNFFNNNYPEASIEPISTTNADELIAFTRKFAAEHEDSNLCIYENTQTINVLKYFDFYPFEGIAIRLGGKIIGYTFGEKIGDTFFVHVEKGDICYRGIYQALASKMSQSVNQRYPEVKYLNREEDMGDDSLRQSKMSYHPTLFVNKRIIRIAVLNEESLLRIA